MSEHGIVGDVSCLKGESINIRAVRHNELNRILMNPFRGPSRYNILRVDIDGGHELISPYPLTKYVYRYINYPYPIILRDLEEVKEGLGLEHYLLEVDGQTEPKPSLDNICIFDSFMEDMIIDRAVELATVGYKENSLQTQLITNLRKE